MAILKSPSIQVIEEDLSQYTTANNVTTAALVGEFEWGPVQSITLVQSVGEFMANFGYPTVDSVDSNGTNVRGCYVDWYSAYNYLQYSSSLSIVRVVEKGTYNSYLDEKKTYSKSTYLIKNIETFTSLLEAKSLGKNDPKVIGRYPGAYGNRVFVSILPGNQKTGYYDDKGNWNPGLDEKTTAEQEACWAYKYVASRKLTSDDIAICVWYAPNEEENYSEYPLYNQPNEYFILSLLTNETDITGYPNEISNYMNKYSKYILINREACNSFVDIIQGQLEHGFTVSAMEFKTSSASRKTTKVTRTVSGTHYITGEQSTYINGENKLNAYNLDNTKVHLFYVGEDNHLKDKISPNTLIQPEGYEDPITIEQYLENFQAVSDGTTANASVMSGSVYKDTDGDYKHYTDTEFTDDLGVLNPVKVCTTTYDILTNKPTLAKDPKSKRNKPAKIEWKNINGSIYSSNSTMKANNSTIEYKLDYTSNLVKDGNMGDEDELFEELEYTYPGIITIEENQIDVTVTGKLTFITTKLNIAIPTETDPEPTPKWIFCTQGYDEYKYTYEEDVIVEGDDKYAAYVTGWDMFSNEETTDVQGQLLIQGSGNVDIGNYMIDLAYTRGDCIACVSPTYDEVVGTRANKLFLETDTETSIGDAIVEAIVTGSGSSALTYGYYSSTDGSGLKASYVFMDGNYKYQYDIYNDVYHWLPLNADIAGIFADLDNVEEPWMSPGGHYIKNCVKLAFYPTKEQRDKLFEYNVNAITNFRGEGNVLWGDWTRVNNTSFNFVSVRRCFLYLERNIKAYARNIMFEQNDDITKAQFVQTVDPFLRNVQAGRGIQEYKLLAGSDITSPEEMDRGIFKAKIIIKPVRSIRYVILTFSALRSDISIEEAV